MLKVTQLSVGEECREGMSAGEGSVGALRFCLSEFFNISRGHGGV